MTGDIKAGTNPSVPASAAAAPMPPVVDVDSVLMSLAAQQKEKLDWKHSIVDLLKVVGLESSLEARETLAAELHYSGDTHDSATMNMWLHKEVIQKIAANGGKVPQELLNK